MIVFACIVRKCALGTIHFILLEISHLAAYPSDIIRGFW